MDHQFRTAAFGGFNRQDVLDYLASSALANPPQLQAVQEQLDQSRKELEESAAQKDEIQALQAQAEELQSQLAQAKVREQELTKALEAAQQRVQQLDLRVTQLEPDAMAYAAVKERSAGVELEAHRRAQNVLDEAKLQARRVRQQTHQWLNQMVQEYNTLRRQLDAALTSAGKQLDQVGQTLSKQDGAFDQLREAYAKTDPDRKPAPTPLNDD